MCSLLGSKARVRVSSLGQTHTSLEQGLGRSHPGSACTVRSSGDLAGWEGRFGNEPSHSSALKSQSQERAGSSLLDTVLLHKPETLILGYFTIFNSGTNKIHS